MEVELRAGAKFDLLSPGEFKDGLSKALPGGWEGEQAARGAGIKPILIKALAPGPPALSLTQAFVLPHTPNSGYIWALRSFSAILSGGQNIRLWYGDSTSTGPTAFPIVLTASASLVSATFSGTQVLLRDGENLVVTANGAVNLNSYVLSFVEVPTELVWKLI